MGEEQACLLKVQNIWKMFGVPDRQPKAAAAALAELPGTICAVRDVSFQVDRGEVFVIMGLSGSGKSTLIRCLLRLLEPTEGRVLVDGADVTGMNKKELTEFRRTKIAMVFQHYGLLPHRNVWENVAFGLKLRGVSRSEYEAAAMEAIERVGLTGWEARYPANLSGGMQQRVGIARALVQNPDILLMDEPFSGLDPLIRREMQDELLRLQTDLHKTIVFVTHDLNEAIRLGDRMAVMRSGVFVQVGRPQEIIANPNDEYVQRFVQDERRTQLVAVTGGRRLNERGQKPAYPKVDHTAAVNAGRG